MKPSLVRSSGTMPSSSLNTWYFNDSGVGVTSILGVGDVVGA